MARSSGLISGLASVLDHHIVNGLSAELTLAADAIGARAEADRVMLLVPQLGRLGAADPDVTNIKFGRNVPRERIVSVHRNATAVDSVAMTRQLAACQHSRSVEIGFDGLT